MRRRGRPTLQEVAKDGIGLFRSHRPTRGADGGLTAVLCRMRLSLRGAFAFPN